MYRRYGELLRHLGTARRPGSGRLRLRLRLRLRGQRDLARGRRRPRDGAATAVAGSGELGAVSHLGEPYGYGRAGARPPGNQP
ncbi:hypothetical protein [Streptomyces tsukubensis]|uniref:hypothetical protein n=1 Tax=Streptomyces tsukubensis TaxID=83656 RepID=UPI0034510220